MFPKNKFRGSDRVIIVGSGPSAANFVAPRGVPIIAVNGAIDWLNRASYFFTLDPSPDNMRRVGRGRRRRGVCYCMALPDVKEREVRDGVLCFRRVAERGTEPKRGPLGKRKISYAKLVFCTDYYPLSVMSGIYPVPA